MQFKEITGDEFNKICKKFKINSFYQTYEWAKIKEKNGWKHYFLCIKKENKILACTLILGKKSIFNKYLYYAPRGFLIDYNNKELLKFFTKEIKKFLKSKNGIALKIDPLIYYKSHDRYGNIINNNISNQQIIDNITNLDYKHKGFTSGYNNDTQFRWSYQLEINKTIEELKHDMDKRCKRCIKTYEKYPLSIIEVNDKNINDFKNIMAHTAKRHKHFDRSLEYYKNINEILNNSKLIIAYLDKEEFLKKFHNHKLYNEIKKENTNMIPISAGLFIFDDNRTNYVYGGTYKKYMPLMAQYKIQIEMIKESIKRKIKIYDFGGISGNFDPKSKNYGVYEFKRGFGGHVVEYIGEFNLIINKPQYIINTIFIKIYKNTKNIIATTINE